MLTQRLMSCSSAIALFGTLLGAPAIAQQSNEANELEEVVVTATGTSIRGVAPVGSSLIEVDREAIDRSASTTTINLLRETPQIFSYGVNDTSRNGSGGSGNIVYGNAINIRGIGPYATLTLINGRRAVPQGTLGATVDPTAVPTIGLERIEVVADGASAVYGSDAIAGVANMILRRGYEGAKVQAQYGVGDSYDEHQFGFIGGTSWDSGNVTLSAQQSYRSNLAGSDRDYYRSDLTSRGGADYRVTSCNPGNIIAGGQTYAIPAGGATAGGLVAGTENTCDNLNASTDLMPEQEVSSVVLTLDQQISDKVSLFADMLVYNRDGERRSEPYDGVLTVPETNAFFVSPTGVALNPCPSSVGVASGTGCLSLDYSFLGENGDSALTTFDTETWQTTIGFDIELVSDWHANVYATAGQNKDRAYSIGNNVNQGNLRAALASSDASTAYNPFGTSANSQAVIDSIFNYNTDTRAKTTIRDYGVKVDGTLFSISGGDVKVAAGMSYYDMHLWTGQSRGNIGELTFDYPTRTRSIKSTFLEFFVPIVGEGNSMPGIHSLELDIAGRIDDYSDVGKTENPKIGINWMPVEDITVHASYGESFRAPGLTQLYSAGGSNMYVQNYYDPTTDSVVRGVALSGGNTGLEPETAETFSIGIDYTPASLPGSRFSLNLFDVVYEGQIGGQLANLNILRQEDVFSSIILRGAAAQARVAELLAAGTGVRSGSVTEAENTPVFVDGRNNNLGSTETRGLDFAMSIPVETDFGGLTFGLMGTWFDYYKVAQTSSAESIDQVNNLDYPMRMRMRGSLGWQNDGWDVTAKANYLNGYDNTLTDEKISSMTTVDLAASYTFQDDSGFTNGLKVGMFVTNLFDRDPPFADIAPTNNGGGGYDPQVASPVGRLISVSLSKEF